MPHGSVEFLQILHYYTGSTAVVYTVQHCRIVHVCAIGGPVLPMITTFQTSSRPTMMRWTLGDLLIVNS